MAKLSKEEKAAAKKEKAEQDDAAIKGMSFAERRAHGVKQMLAGVNKKFGANSIGLAANLSYKPVPRISSGIFILDYALGGGWARGRVNTLWGDRSASKTTTALRTVAMAQNTDVITGQFLWEREWDLERIKTADVAFMIEYLKPFDLKLAAQLAEKSDQKKIIKKAVEASIEAFPPITPMVVQYIDVEGAIDFNWARKLGVNTDAMIYSRPDTSEESAEMVESAILSSGVDLSVLDSLAAMIPQAESEGAMDDNHMGLAARINSKMFRKVQGAINKINKSTDGQVLPTLILINQIRQKIGVMFGSPDIKPGGVAQDFYGSIEVKFSGNKVNYYDKDTKQLPRASEFNFVVVKNKVSPPKIHGTYEMMLVDEPKDGGLKAGEIDEIKQVIGFAEQVGLYGKSDDENRFKMYDEEVPTKKEIYEKYVVDRRRFSTLKKDVVGRLVPKQ